MTEQEKALRKTRTKQFEPCPGTPTGCICRDLIRLYEQDKLPLHCGKISRFRAAQSLHIPKTSLLKSSRSPRFAVARKCVSHVDHHLQRWGHGTPWQERIPAIEARLRDLKEAGRLPTNSKGDHSRSAVLKPFGAETYVAQVTQLHPEIKALLDRYDITRADPSYGRHKHAPRAPDLRELLEAPDLVLTRQYRINQRELNSKLGIPN